MRIVIGKKLDAIIKEKSSAPSSLTEILESSKDLEEKIKSLEKLAQQKKSGALEKDYDNGVEEKNTMWQGVLKEKLKDDHDVNTFGDEDFRLDAIQNNNWYRLSITAVNGNTFFISLSWAQSAHRTIDMDYVHGKNLVLCIEEIISLFKKVEANK
jgi:hypothetical protein